MTIDPQTYSRYLRARDNAAVLGMELSEVLDHNRLLLTEQREHGIRVQVLEDLYRRFEAQSAAKLMQYYLGRTSGTPEEMFRAVQEWLEAVVRGTANNTLEES